MKSVFEFLKIRKKEIDLLQNEVKSKQKEIDSLRKENKIFQDAVYPLISLGIPIEKMAETITLIVSILDQEAERKRKEASYHDSGKSSTII
jgi:hypothetical protein